MKKKIGKCWNGEILWDCAMDKFSTLKVGGEADAVIFPANVSELSGLVQKLVSYEVPWKVVGNGSNIVVSDKGIEGVVIIFHQDFSSILDLGKSKNPKDELNRKLYVDAGCSLMKLMNWCVEYEVGGFEFASGIPGTLGGAIIMNAGAWGKEISEVVSSVSLMDNQGETKQVILNKKDFGYRRWNGCGDDIIVGANLLLYSSTKMQIKEKCQKFSRIRKQKQPIGLPSAGSFFKNPPEKAAGWYIEQANLTGFRVGGAEVSQLHANFFINNGNAVADDFKQLMQLVQDKVKNQFDVDLHPEVEFLGRWE